MNIVYTNGKITIYESDYAYWLEVCKFSIMNKFDKEPKMLNKIIDYAKGGAGFSRLNGKGIRIYTNKKQPSLAKIAYCIYNDIPISKAPNDPIRFLDKDISNCMSENLYSSSESVMQTKYRKISNDDMRIYFSFWKCKERYFTDYEQELLELLSSSCFSWIYTEVKRKDGTCRQVLNAAIYAKGDESLYGTHFHISGIVWAYYNLGMRADNIIEPLKCLQALYDKGFVIDHIRDNQRNQCRHNLSMMTNAQNTSKHNLVSSIQLPYALIPFYTDDEYRIFCGRYNTTNSVWEWNRFYKCTDVDTFIVMLKDFELHAKTVGDMLEPITDGVYTNCVSRMLVDDGKGDLQKIIDAPSSKFEIYRAEDLAECFQQQA